MQGAAAVAVKEQAVELDVVCAAGFVGGQSTGIEIEGPPVWSIVPWLSRAPVRLALPAMVMVAPAWLISVPPELAVWCRRSTGRASRGS